MAVESRVQKRADTTDFDVGLRLKQVRTRAGLTQRQLAERAGVTHGLISMLEANKNSPSIASLRKILGGIPMTMVEFFEPERPASAQVFFRPEDLADLTGRVGHAHGNGSSGAMSFRQVGDPRAHNLQILHERYAPGADTGETMLEHQSHEGGVVIAGELEVTVGDEVRVLKPGDAYLFDSRVPHRFRNISDRTCEVVSACSPPWL